MLTLEQVVAHENLEVLSVRAFAARFESLGYVLDRSLDCRAPARYMTGPLAGQSYLACTTGIRERDTGMSAFHFRARRDDNFRAMQDLRKCIAAVSRGALLQV